MPWPSLERKRRVLGRHLDVVESAGHGATNGNVGSGILAVRRNLQKPPFVPTPRQISQGAAAIRAGWDERELLMRTGLSAIEAAERLAGVSYSVPVVVVEPRERAPVE